MDRASGGGYGGLRSYRRDGNNGSSYRSNNVSSGRTGPEPPKRQESSLRFNSNLSDNRRQETPSLRYGSTARFGSQIARSPISEKSNAVFGVGGGKAETVVLVSRSTSPSAPAESAYVRQRRADREILETKEVPIPNFRPPVVSALVQTESDKPPVQVPSQPSSGIRYTPRPLGITDTQRTRPTDLAIKQETPSLRSFGRSTFESKSPEIRSYSRPVETRSPSSDLRSPTSSNPTSIRPFSYSRPKPESPDPSRSKLNIVPPQFPKTDANKNFIVNKDFRKSTLNMDSINANDSVKNESEINKSPSKTSTGLNLKVAQSKTMGNVLAKRPDSSSSSESSSSESESSSDESSEDEKPLNKEITKTEAVVVRAVPPLASPQKVQAWNKEKLNQNDKANLQTSIPSLKTSNSNLKPINSNLQTSNSTLQSPNPNPQPPNSNLKLSNSNLQPSNPSIQSSNTNFQASNSILQNSHEPSHKGFALRKFDSTDVPWWAESSKDVPSLSKKPSKANLAKKSTKDVPGSLKVTSSSDESTGLPRPVSKSKIPPSKSSKDIPVLNKPQESSADTDSLEESLPPLPKIPSKSRIEGKSNKDLHNLVKAPSVKSIHESSDESSTGLKKLPSKTNLIVMSNKDLPRLTKVPSLKAIAPDRNVGKEFTPGLNRLHARFEEERRSYKLRRVESEADREWWLDDEENETEEQRRRKKFWAEDQIYLGLFKDADFVFGTKAPPPWSFKFSDEESK